MKGAKGNIANQKYEATKNIERHLRITTETPATWETSRWRRYEPNFNFHKQKGRLVQAEKRINLDNKFLSERIEEIVEEDRQHATVEYAPGWRVGRGNHLVFHSYFSSKVLNTLRCM
jgi:hypothetical protein